MAEDRPGVETSFVNSRGVELRTKEWLPDGPPSAAVVFLHGWNMSVTNNKAWQRVANLHTSRGLVCTGLDYSGHGQSKGSRSFVFVEDLSLTADDVLQHVRDFAQRHPGLPIFLRSQSLGGLVALMAALREPGLFSGLALGAPPFEIAGLFGRLDRWRLVRWHAVPAAAAFVRQEVGGLSVPLAVFQGLEDGTCAPVGARQLFQSAGSKDRSLYLYRDMGHNMSMEPDVLDWLQSRIKTPAQGGVALLVRHPKPGAEWPPRPGCETAASNTELDTIAEADHTRVLDELLPV